MELTKPNEALQVASTLQTFVTERKLTANIQGKNYPLVEAWQFAGSQLGLIPVVKEVKNLSTDTELKYEAMVEVIRLTDGVVLSRGYAVCSNKENSKRRFDEYAIASMAQTRAVGKAYRNILAWLMKAAGFEATPAEEMDFIKDEVGDEGRDFLLNLLDASTYEGKVRDKLYIRITGILNNDDYEKAKKDLLANQVGIDAISNPSQKDINRHLKNSIK
ncbi:MAG: hypothetical protein FJY17_00645 [Bacteroidetes bacterium]|nr:hypothetical protein [Bacteroidota bacterium]